MTPRKVALGWAGIEGMKTREYGCRTRSATRERSHSSGQVIAESGKTTVTHVVGIYQPQEFLLLIARTGQFEFVGWFGNWSLDAPVPRAGLL